MTAKEFYEFLQEISSGVLVGILFLVVYMVLGAVFGPKPEEEKHERTEVDHGCCGKHGDCEGKRVQVD